MLKKPRIGLRIYQKNDQNADQIMDDLIPTDRLKGDIFCRGYWSKRSRDPDLSGMLDDKLK